MSAFKLKPLKFSAVEYVPGMETGHISNPKGVGFVGTPYVDTSKGRQTVNTNSFIITFEDGYKEVWTRSQFERMATPVPVRKKAKKKVDKKEEE